MKRRLLKLVVFLLLGVIISVAISWSCAAFIKFDMNRWGRPMNERGGFSFLNCGGWYVGRVDRPGATRVSSLISPMSSNPGHHAHSLLPNWINLADPCRGVTRGEMREEIFDARGWPMLALRSRVVFVAHSVDLSVHSNEIPKVRIDGTEGGLILDDRNNDDWKQSRFVWHVRVLPFKPIWPGFAINTILYAAMLWILTIGSFTARRIIHRRRGHCIKCGYDLCGAEHEACPECGRRVLSAITERSKR